MRYIEAKFYEQLFGVELHAADQKESLNRSVTCHASEIVNTVTGNRIESVGYANLSEQQQGTVQKATAYQTQHFLNTGLIDMQPGSVSMGLGPMSFSYNTPSGILKYAEIHPMVRDILSQAGLYQTTYAFNPLTSQEVDLPQKYVFKKWNLSAMDNSLFISDGTTTDGGQVQMKISDPYQHEITKLIHTHKSEKHLVYEDTSDAPNWQYNSLIFKAYVDDLVKGNPNIGNEWRKLRAEIDQILGELNELKHTLPEEWKQARQKLEDYLNKIDEAFAIFIKEVKYDLNTIKPELEKWKKQLKSDLEKWILEELKKDKYKGPKGDPGEISENLKVLDEIMDATSYGENVMFQYRESKNPLIRYDNDITHKKYVDNKVATAPKDYIVDSMILTQSSKYIKPDAHPVGPYPLDTPTVGYIRNQILISPFEMVTIMVRYLKV